MKGFFKDVLNWFKDMPDVFRFLLVGFLVIVMFLMLRQAVKSFYGKDKVKISFRSIPIIIVILLMIALVVVLCVTA